MLFRSAAVAGIRLEPTLEAAIQNADLLALMVPHTPLLGLNPGYVAGVTPARLAVDAVNGWARQAWEAAGFQVFRLGVGAEGDLQ